MNIVIIGAGKVGRTLASALIAEDHDVTLIDNNPEMVARMQNSLDAICLEGDGAVADVQKEAGVEKAGLVIAVTPSDELNIFCCLIAKRLGAKQTIPRVRTPAYFRQMGLVKDELRLPMIINPELAAADEILRVLIFSTASKVEVFGKGKLELVEYHLPQKNSLNNMSLREIYQKIKTRFLICAVQREDDVYIPGGNFILQGGDWIHIVATHRNIERVFRFSGSRTEKVKSVMIVGGGTMCYYLAQQLLDLGMKLKIIEIDHDRCMDLAEMFPKAVIVQGDGTDQALLLEEGVRDVDAFVALTGMDEENILLSLYAKEAADVKVITKVDRDNYAELAENLGLDCVITAKNLTTDNIISYVRSKIDEADSDMESMYRLVGDQVEAVEFQVRERIPDLTDIPLKYLHLKKDILVCAIVRGNEIIIPNGDESVQVGDQVVVVSKDYHFSKLREILE